MRKALPVILVSVVVICLLLQFLSAPDGGRTPRSGEVGPAPSTPAADTAVAQRPVVLPLFQPRDGEQLAFRFTMQSQADFKMAQLLPREARQGRGELSRYRVTAAGEMAMTFLALQPGRWAGVVHSNWQEYRINGVQPQFAAQLNTVFSFEMDQRGTISVFKFKQGLDEAAAGTLRQLILSMQIVLPENAVAKGWTTHETDTDGSYRAEYAIVALAPAEQTIRLSKNKGAYMTVKAAPAPDSEKPVPTVDESSIAVTLSTTPAWITQISVSEAKSWYKDGEKIGTSAATLAANRIPASALMLPKSLAELNRYLTAADLLKSKYYQTDPEMNQLAQGRDLQGAIALFAKLWLSNDERQREIAERFLVNYLRLFPQQAAAYVQFLDRSRPDWLSEEVELRMWHYLTKAGHLEAQLAMTEVLNSPDYNTLTRYRVLAYLHDFEYPQPQALAQLRQFIAQLSHQSGTQADEMRAMAYYVLGTSGAYDKLNTEVQAQVRRQLAADLSPAAPAGNQAVVLQAMGNQGDVTLLPTITPYLSSPDAMVRANAYEALRRMPGEAAVEQLIQSLAGESAGRVREAALQTLSIMPARAAAMPWAQQALLTPAPTAEREILIDILGRAVTTQPGNEAALRRLLAQNPERKLKQRIYQYIRPQ